MRIRLLPAARLLLPLLRLFGFQVNVCWLFVFFLLTLHVLIQLINILHQLSQLGVVGLQHNNDEKNRVGHMYHIQNTLH